jgi:hypothetical protein
MTRFSENCARGIDSGKKQNPYPSRSLLPFFSMATKNKDTREEWL